MTAPTEFLSLGKYNELNPVRDHIELHFVDLDPEDAVRRIHEELNARMDTERSRAIVFCHSRRATEEAAHAMNVLFADVDRFRAKAAHFHAGLEADARSSLVNRFKDGDVLVLFATKAFGMGMDIRNIHYAYHLGPSSTFEDYLQEVGRAGRDHDALEKAGFTNGERIKALCFATEDSYRKAQDRIQRDQVSWNDILNAFGIFREFFVRFNSGLGERLQAGYLPVPLNILSTSPQYRDRNQEPAGLYRTALYWMDRMGRMGSRYLVPALLEFKNDDRLDQAKTNTIPDEQVRRLHALVCEARNLGYAGQESTLVDGAYLIAQLGLTKRDDLFQIIIRARRQGHLTLKHEVRIDITELGRSEVLLRGGIENLTDGLWMVDAACSMANALIGSAKVYEAFEPEAEWLGQEWSTVIQGQLVDRFVAEMGGEEPVWQYLTTPSIRTMKQANEAFRIWLAGMDRSSQDRLRQMRRIVKGSALRMKCVFDLLRSEGAATCTSVIAEDNPSVRQRIVLKKAKKEVAGIMDRTTTDVRRLFEALHKIQGPVKDLGKVIIDAGLDERKFEEIEHCFVLLRKLGYIRFHGGLVPMAIEAELKDATPIGEQPGDEAVRTAYHDAIRLRKLRLIVLQAFSGIQDRSEQDDFIKEYFACRNADDIIALLELHLPKEKADAVLAAFREGALEEQVERLNSGQKAVYDADIRTNLCVKAGPGTGKTHTLVLRVARLIQKEHIPPNRILVLAYNRAVVEELKLRLKRLFTALGYHSLTRALKVQTFHGLMYSVLNRNGQVNVPMNEVKIRFAELMAEQGRAALGDYREVGFVFVDEFQDITAHRLATLKAIAPPGVACVTVIGDPNQSIYGYERVQDGAKGNIAPGPYYAKFNRLYGPQEMYLSLNYRSTQAIIATAMGTLPEGDRDLSLRSSRPFVTDLEDDSVTVVRDGDWTGSLNGLVASRKYDQIAVLFRSNRELYSAYPAANRIAAQADYHLRVKGSGAVYVKRREVAAALDMLRENPDAMEESVRRLEEQFPKWDASLLHEVRDAWKYYVEMVSQDQDQDQDGFRSFLADLTGREDGQLEELLRQYFGRTPRKEVILSTMHKAKGLEYQSVLLPPGNVAAPYGNHPNDMLGEAIAEERRVRYVACSRAKEKLVVHEGERERALNNGQANTTNNARGGLFVAPDNMNTVLSWKADQNRCAIVHRYIRDRVRVGDELSIRRLGNNYYVIHGDVEMELLMSSWVQGKLQAQQYVGLLVSAIVRYTADECQRYDLEKGKKYYQGWCPEAQAKGYIYMVEFHGEPKPI
jgi:superfamily I DNA/RNA helicase